MAGTYYETDRLFSLVFVLVVTAFLYALLRWDEKRRGINDRNRAEKYRKYRNGR